MVATKVTRKYIDCREYPDASGCTMVLQAEDVKEEEGMVEGECVVLPVLQTDGVPLWDALRQ